MAIKTYEVVDNGKVVPTTLAESAFHDGKEGDELWIKDNSGGTVTYTFQKKKFIEGVDGNDVGRVTVTR